MSKPPYASLAEHCKDGVGFCFSESIEVGNLVLLGEDKHPSQRPHIKYIDLILLANVCRPCFASLQEGA